MLGFIIIVSALSLCSEGAKAPPDDVLTVMQQAGHFTKFLTALNASGLVDTVLNQTSVTVFAPIDSSIPPNVTLDLDTLKFHIVVNESIKLANRVADTVHGSMALQPVRLNVYRTLGIYAAEGVEVTQRNLATSTGYVHGLSGVMVPPAGNAVYILSQRFDTVTFHTLLNQTGLLDTVKNDQNITLFAPSNAAFTNLPPDTLNHLWSHQDLLREVLLYHVVDRTTLYSVGMRHHMTFITADKGHDRVIVIEDGTGHVFVNEARVTSTDISATNGVIHVVDQVMVPTKVLLQLEEAGLPLVG